MTAAFKRRSVRTISTRRSNQTQTGHRPRVVRITMLAWPKVKRGALPVTVDVEYSRLVLFFLLERADAVGGLRFIPEVRGIPEVVASTILVAGVWK